MVLLYSHTLSLVLPRAVLEEKRENSWIFLPSKQTKFILSGLIITLFMKEYQNHSFLGSI